MQYNADAGRQRGSNLEASHKMTTGVLPRRILIVDDEPLIRWCIAETLGTAGYGITEAQDAASTLRALTNMPEPDVILLDLRLPDSSDLSLLKRIRIIAPAAAVIIMTAFGTPETTAEALKLGARGVLTKPFDMRDLEHVVGSL
jgi:DNA-binding NtrC family response regulator